ncbi:putative asparagine synthase [Mycena filopes]|nr:putative asparagine synthase [Mycena filopes]
MCGLISAFYPDGVNAPSAEDLQRCLETSLQTIKYRGPDSQGTYISPDNRVGLGHARLSMIDLSTGQQPLSDEDDSIHCVVTGEIYDHDRIRAEMQAQGYSFKSKSDSELVVQLYKRDGFNLMPHLRGEFAFVLHDVKRRLQFVARERFGIKPLYYTVFNRCILFASEMKAFMELGWQAEWDSSVVHNADFGDDRTVFKGVRKLPAGHLAICRASGSIEMQAYWDLSYPSATADPTESVDSMILTIRELLVDAVRLRLRSDVPLAAYLSGGIDSSAVAGIATHLLREKDPHAKLTAFTLAYVGAHRRLILLLFTELLPQDETTDESPLAARTAEHLGANLIQVDATEAALIGVFEESVWHTETINTTFYGPGKLLLSKAVKDAGYKVTLELSLAFRVALSGEGSNELFGGYAWFYLDYLRNADPAAAHLGISLPTGAERRAMVRDHEATTGMPDLPRNAMSPLKSDAPRRLLNISAHLITTAFLKATAALFRPEIIRDVGKPDVPRCVEEGIDPQVRQNSIAGNWHSLNLSLYTVSKTMLSRTILNIAGDRNDMAHSIESRVSFLDHRLVEYANGLPPPGRHNTGKWSLVEKWILRQAVKPFVTEDVYLRKKVAFNPPPSTRPAVASGLLPLQVHLEARISWPFVRDQLAEYLQARTFPPQGKMDPRARVLLAVLDLSYIVLQERFCVPTFRF